MFVYFLVLAHVCDVNEYAMWADLSSVLRLGSVDGNATAERIQLFHSGGWFQIYAFSCPKNAVTVWTKGTPDKIFCRFHPQASSCKRGLSLRNHHTLSTAQRHIVNFVFASFSSYIRQKLSWFRTIWYSILCVCVCVCVYRLPCVCVHVPVFVLRGDGYTSELISRRIAHASCI